jgi:hypothetical protein
MDCLAQKAAKWWWGSSFRISYHTWLPVSHSNTLRISKTEIRKKDTVFWYGNLYSGNKTFIFPIIIWLTYTATRQTGHKSLSPTQYDTSKSDQQAQSFDDNFTVKHGMCCMTCWDCSSCLTRLPATLHLGHSPITENTPLTTIPSPNVLTSAISVHLIMKNNNN